MTFNLILQFDITAPQFPCDPPIRASSYFPPPFCPVLLLLDRPTNSPNPLGILGPVLVFASCGTFGLVASWVDSFTWSSTWLLVRFSWLVWFGFAASRLYSVFCSVCFLFLVAELRLAAKFLWFLVSVQVFRFLSTFHAFLNSIAPNSIANSLHCIVVPLSQIHLHS